MADDIFKKLLEDATAKRSEDFTDTISESEIDLNPVGGLRILHTLTADEKHEYVNLLGVHTRFIEMGEILTEQYNISLAEDVLSGKSKSFMRPARKPLHPDVQSALEEFLYMEALWNKVSGAFWFNLRQKLNCFTSYIEIRAGFTVVETGSKTGS